MIEAGVHVLQLRDKQLGDRELLERAGCCELDAAQGTPSTLLIVNDRPDLAVLAQADGVHVGQEELSVKDARSIVGPDMLIGVSTHSIEQARQAVLDGANYIGVGPTFPSGTKRFEQFPGRGIVAGRGGRDSPARLRHRRHRSRERGRSVGLRFHADCRQRRHHVRRRSGRSSQGVARLSDGPLCLREMVKVRAIGDCSSHLQIHSIRHYSNWSNSSTSAANSSSAASTGAGCSMSTPASRSKSNGSLEQPPPRKRR